MRKFVAMTTLTLFSLAPAIGFACEYNDASMASATPPARLALAPAPEASKAPARAVVAAPAPKAVKQEQVKVKAPVTDAKLVVNTN